MFKQLTFRSGGAIWPLTERADYPRAPYSGGQFAVFGAVARRLAGGALSALKLRRAMQALADLDDRILRDIGVERSQIESACRQGRRALLRSSDLRAEIGRWS